MTLDNPGAALDKYKIMTYRFSHFSKQIAVTLEESGIAVLVNRNGRETAWRLPYAAIRKIHLSASGVNICRCKLFFDAEHDSLSLSSINVHLKLVRPDPDQFAAYRLFIEALHRKILKEEHLREKVAFVCGDTAKMCFFIAVITAFFLITVPMAVRIGRYETLFLPLGSVAVLLSSIRKTGFTRPYHPEDRISMASFLPAVND